MKPQHPSEELIQQYAASEYIGDSVAADHISTCKQCRIAAANYRLLFGAIQQASKPVFDFNTTELVLNSLQTPAANAAKNKSQGNIMMMIAGFLVIVPLYVFRKFFFNVAAGVSSALLIIISAAAITIILYKSIDMYKNYQNQIDKLNFH